MTPGALLAKADIALGSARLLLDTGDVDGACNRVYYAMYDAARAALIAIGAPAEAWAARTHGGLIAAFGQYVVKPGLASVEHGRALNRLHELRLIADYRGDSVEPELVRRAFDDCAAFLVAIKAMAGDDRG